MALPFQFNRLRPSRYADQQLMADEYRRTRPALVENEPAPVRVAPKSDTINLPPLSDEDLDFARRQGERGGKPTIDPRITDPLERQQDYRTQVEGYEPKKASWKEHLPQMIMTALAGARGGVPGIIGSAGVALADRFVRPKQPNEQWKRREIGETDERIGKLETEGYRRAQAENQQSEAEARRIKPRLEAEKAAAAEDEKRIANLLTMHGRLGHYNPDDVNDVASQQIKQQAAELGVDDILIPYSEKEKVPRIPPHVTVGDTVYERSDTGDWMPAKGLPRIPPKAEKDVEDVEPKRAAKIKEAEELVNFAEIYDNNAAEAENELSRLDPESDKTQIASLQAKINSLREQAQQSRTAAVKARSEANAMSKVAPKVNDPLKGAKWSKSKYRGKKPIEQAAQEAAARGAVIVD